MAAALLDKVIAAKLALGCADRYDALVDIGRSFDGEFGPFATAKTFGVLVNDSAEDFAIEFMSAYNAEVGCRY